MIPQGTIGKLEDVLPFVCVTDDKANDYAKLDEELVEVKLGIRQRTSTYLHER